MLSHGCITFLAIIEEVPAAAPGLKDILIAREVPGVNLLELILKPPFREIEFKMAIDEVLGTAPTSVAPR